MSWEQGVATGMEKVAFERGLVKMASEAEADGESLLWVDDGRAWLVDPEQGLIELEKTAFVRKTIGAIGKGAKRVGGEARHLALKAAPAISSASAAANRMSHFGPTHAMATGAAHLATDAGKALKKLKPKSRAGRVLQGAVAPASELAGVVLH